MPTVRYTSDGGHYRVGGHGFEPGDEKDVDEELAAYLEDIDDFDVVYSAGGESGGQEDEPPDADTCQEVMDNDEVCGRELPCQYHTDEED